MEWLKEWYYKSQSKKSKGGLIFMVVSAAALIGVWVYIATQTM